MNKISTAYKALFIWIFIVIVVLAGYVFLFSEVKEKNESVSFLVETLAFEVERAGRLKSIEAIVEDTKEEREILEGYFLAEDDVVPFLTTIEDLSRRVGANIEVKSADVTPVESGIPELSLEIGGTGKQQAIVGLFEVFDALPYVINFTHVELSYVAETGGEGSWQVSFSLRVLMRT